MFRPYRFAIIILLGLLASGALAQTTGQKRRITVAFNGGLNLRDRPAVLGRIDDGQADPYVVGDSYNFDFFPDGTARKRPGMDDDKLALAGQDSAVNFMQWLPLLPTTGATGKVLLHAGTKWYSRLTDGTAAASAYATLTAVHQLNARDSTFIGHALYGSELFVASESMPVARFDGSGMYRVPVEDWLGASRATAKLVLNGSLDTSQTYYYAHTYVVAFGQSNGNYQEGPLSSPARVTTYDTTAGYYRTVTYTAPTRPSSISASGDSTQIVGINIYRSTNGVDFYYLTTVSPSVASYTDTGALSVDETSRGRDPRVYPTRVSDIEEQNDFLFMLGRVSIVDTLWRAKVRLHGKTVVTGGFQYTVTHIGDADGNKIVNQTDAIRILKYVTGSPGTGFRYRNADVTGVAGVSATDASTLLTAIANGTTAFSMSVDPLTTLSNVSYLTLSDGTNSRSITHILSDSTFTISGDSLAQFTTNTYTITGPPLSRSGLFYVDTDGNVPIVENWSEPIRPTVRQSNLQRIIGLSSTLAMFGQFGAWEFVGTDMADATVQRLAPRAGLVGRGAATSYRGGAAYLDYAGLYYLASATQPILLSDILGTAIIDSTAAGRLNATTVAEQDDDLFAATIDAGDKTDVWRYATDYNTWTRYKGWHVSSFGEWPTNTGRDLDLYIGDRRKGNVYRVDPTLTKDASITGADSAITCQLITPQYNFGDRDTWFEEFRLVIDTADSVRVSFQIGQFDSVYSFNATPLTTTNAADYFTAGTPGVYIFPIHATGNTCQITIWTQGTGRCTIYPSTLVMTDPKDQ